jgi:maleate isomerase
MREFIEARGVSVPVMGSFNESDDNKVGRISSESIREAALELGRSDLVDTVFVACTNMRLVEFAAGLEAELGKPVTSSNHAMAWHCLRLAGIEDPQAHLGRLFTLPLA